MTPPIWESFITLDNVDGLTEAEVRVVLNSEKGKKEIETIFGEKASKDKVWSEAKEKMKTPQLEKENHKIDQGMSLEEKLKNGWKKEKNVFAYINGVEKKVAVLKKTIEWWAKDAFVWEYIDDGVMPKSLIGEPTVQSKCRA